MAIGASTRTSASERGLRVRDSRVHHQNVPPLPSPEGSRRHLHVVPLLPQASERMGLEFGKIPFVRVYTCFFLTCARANFLIFTSFLRASARRSAVSRSSASNSRRRRSIVCSRTQAGPAKFQVEARHSSCNSAYRLLLSRARRVVLYAHGLVRPSARSTMRRVD